MRDGGRGWRLLPPVLAMALVACHPAPRPAPPQTRVDYHAVADASLPHYVEDMTTGVISPTGMPANAAPDYPAALLAKRLAPVEIRAVLIVGADGRVHEARMTPATDGDEAAFMRAVAAATLSWRFEPLRVTHWEELPDGGVRRIADIPSPFSQTYVFRFEIRDGKPVVSSGAAR